jgi:hypothetical protein
LAIADLLTCYWKGTSDRRLSSLRLQNGSAKPDIRLDKSPHRFSVINYR